MAWEVLANDDQEVIQNTQNFLRKSDLQVLCDPTGWLTDALMNWGVQKFAGTIGPLTDLHNNILWVDPAVVAAGKDGNNEAFAASLAHVLGPRAALDSQQTPFPQNAKAILFPVNTGNRHWSLLVFTKADRQFVHFDSLASDNNPAARALIDRLSERGYLSAPLQFTTNADVQRQRDGYNCGMFVVQFARKMMDNGSGTLSQNVLQNITSGVCDQVRQAMLRELSPLVAEGLPTAELRDPSESGLLIDPISDPIDEAKTVLEALKKIEEQIEHEDPVPLTGVRTCTEAKPTFVTVTLKSSKPEDATLIGGSVKFVVKSESNAFTRRARRAGREWKTGIKLQIEEPVQITVTGKAQAGVEFVKEEIKADPVTVNMGDSKLIEIAFEPKKPRRFFVKLQFLDHVEKKQRPFPAGFKVELILDDEAKRSATTRADCLLLDDQDNQPGVRVPHRFKGVWMRFPKAKRRRFGWKKDSAATDATFFDEDEQVKEGNGRTALLPGGGWHQNRDDWEWPARHKAERPKKKEDKDEFQRHAELKDENSLGTEGQPVTYTMKTVPQSRMMNGHPIDHVIVLMMENRGFDHFMGYLYEGSDKPKFSYPPAPKGPHAKLRVFEGLEGLNPRMPYRYNYDFNRKNPDYDEDDDDSGPEYFRENETAEGVVRLRKGARSSHAPSTNPHEDFVHIFQDMYGVDEKDQIVIVHQEHDMGTAANRDAIVKHAGHYKEPQMRGWAQNFCDGIIHHRRDKASEFYVRLVGHEHLIDEIGDIYLPSQIPVISGLARHYAVSDLWFCSVPSQTNTNRMFWMAGHAGGLVKNDWRPAFKHGAALDELPKGENKDGIPYRRSLFHVLDNHNIRSAYYVSMPFPFKPYYYPTSMMPGAGGKKQYILGNEEAFINRGFDDPWEDERMWDDEDDSEPEPDDDAHYHDDMPDDPDGGYGYYSLDQPPPSRIRFPWMTDFYRDLEAGTLPPVCYLEPFWGGGYRWEPYKGIPPRTVGNEFHPVADMFCGEFYLKRLYEKIIASPKWDTTLFVITFDENGGTYDHFPPWEATKPEREDGAEKGNEFGYEYDSYGVRVPTLLISKYIKEGTLFRSPTDKPFDHTSVIATILKWLEIPKDDWKLGERVANAPTFDEVLQSSGDEDAARQKVACGVADYDPERKKRAGSAKIQYGDTFHLMYVGNKWDMPAPDVVDYLGDHYNYRSGANWSGTWYPIATRDKQKALKFKFAGGAGDFKSGEPCQILVAEGEARDYGLCVTWKMDSTDYGQAREHGVFLYKDSDKYKKWLTWTVWQHNDRNQGAPLYFGDEVLIFSEVYEPGINHDKSSTGMFGYDPYQRLSLDPFDAEAPKAKRHAWHRPGFWDLWRIVKG